MEKIDFVIAWVDGNDSKWQKKRNAYSKGDTQKELSERYRDWGLLRYIMRGIEMYAPWVHHVYLVTDEQKPEWLNEACPKLTVVDHKAFIPAEYLPTFNTNTIELNLHRIPGLSEQFVYFNDDMMITGKCDVKDFFERNVPVDEASLNGINGNDQQFAEILFTDMALMNRHYTVEDCKKHIGKWLRLSYGKNLLRTLLLLPFQRLQGIYNHHGPMPILKSTCETIWQRDRDMLDATCQCKFREGRNVSAYVYRYEQLLSGNFVPKKAQNKYCTVSMPIHELERDMKKYKMVCINDEPMDEAVYEIKKQQITEMMEKKFSKKSIFEK